MGTSIAINIASKGYKTSVYNYEKDITENFAKHNIDNITPFYNLKDFIESLKDTKIVFIMVTAGDAVDSVIDSIKSYLSKGDIIIDGGNSYYKDTIRRYKELKNIGIDYLGAGVSGGEKGALLGPSIMASGDKNAYDKVSHILNDIAAKAKDEKPCSAYIGENGAGHYVKMVHNGIEYADMQIICEAYDILRNAFNLSPKDISDIFKKWNSGKLKSYLIEITGNILSKKDDLTSNYLIDVILDKAGNKGTGKWICIESFNLGISIPTIAEAMYARFLSEKKEERVLASNIFNNIKESDKKYDLSFIGMLENAVYMSKICCYAQGFDLLKEAGKVYGWDFKFDEISEIWRAGCIIKADFLDEIKKSYRNNDMHNLMLKENFSKNIAECQNDLRYTINYAINNGVYIPAMAASLEYFDGYKSKKTSANLIQAQRDYFGSHKYERIDKEGLFHTNWED